MKKVLIAYNNDSECELHDFFESCADEAKAFCVENNLDYISIFPPTLNKDNVIDSMLEYDVCVLSAHGDSSGIYNEGQEEIVSIHTINYNFKDKGFYAIACSCAQNLYPQLRQVGLSFFVGYSGEFRVKGEREPFVVSAMSGLKSLMQGNTIEEAKMDMLRCFDEQIKLLDGTNPWAAAYLLNNRECLVFEGENIFV